MTPRQHPRPAIAGVLWLRWLGTILAALAPLASAQSPPAQLRPADNPALERFSRAITFYVSFDHGLHAELATGQPDPTGVGGDPQFQSGLYGRAVWLARSDGLVGISYALLENIDVTRPGALAVWLSPRGWVRGDQEDYFWPVNIIGNNGVQLMFGRQGQLLNPLRRQDMVYLWARVGATKGFCVIAGGSLGWKNDAWHLWVMNWRSNSVEFSLDGGPLQRQDTPVRISAAGGRDGSCTVGPQAPSCHYLLDELIVFDRPLDADEANWLYKQGIKQTVSK